MKTRKPLMALTLCVALAVSVTASAGSFPNTMQLRNLLVDQVTRVVGQGRAFFRGEYPHLYGHNRGYRELNFMSQTKNPGFWKAAEEAPNAVVVELSWGFRKPQPKLLIYFDVPRGFREVRPLDHAFKSALERQLKPLDLPVSSNPASPARIGFEDYPTFPQARPDAHPGDARTLALLQEARVGVPVGAPSTVIRLDTLSEAQVTAVYRIIRETLDVLLNEGTTGLARL